MSRLVIHGIDPGLVHTGLVTLQLDTRNKGIFVEHLVVDDEDVNHAEAVKQHLIDLRYDTSRVFIESYRPRGNTFSTDPYMRALLHEFRRRFPQATVLDNTGVKKVVRKPLLRELGLDKFPTTHHQDLEAAARILVYGMLKDDDLNAVVTTIVKDKLAGNPWPIQK